jgi:hypothetical protein
MEERKINNQQTLTLQIHQDVKLDVQQILVPLERSHST